MATEVGSADAAEVVCCEAASLDYGKRNGLAAIGFPGDRGSNRVCVSRLAFAAAPEARFWASDTLWLRRAISS